VDFSKGQRKDDVMHEHLKYFTPVEGVVFIGRAQEKTTVFRTEKRRHPDGVAYPWIVKTTGVVKETRSGSRSAAAEARSSTISKGEPFGPRPPSMTRTI
jgi:hypothetical protein